METDIFFRHSFPASALYTDRITTTGPMAVRDAPHEHLRFAYSERHVQCVWADDQWRPPVLRTLDGETVTVISPGRWNLEAGPDFLDAEFCVGDSNRRLRGDVEIHVRACDWTRHGHADDPRYANLAAHVSYYDGTLPRKALPPGTLQLALAPHLEGDPASYFERIDTTAYPYATRTSPQPPCQATLARWTPDEARQLLCAAGQERLRCKASRMAQSMERQGSEQVFYEECLSALGYKHNRNAARLLARRLPASDLQDVSDSTETAYALLLGVAGLLPKRIDPRWDIETAMFMRRLWDCWWKHATRWEDRIMAPETWIRAGVRPQNHPMRRLAVAAALWGRPGRTITDELQHISRNDPTTWFGELERLFNPEETIPFWSRRLGLRTPQGVHPVAFVGTRRVAALAMNVVIPFLAAQGEAVTSLLEGIPAEHDNSIVRHTACLLFGRDASHKLYQSALAQQGLLQIFHDFCIKDRSHCSGCALACAVIDCRAG
jgi:hypothetical protein